MTNEEKPKKAPPLKLTKSPGRVVPRAMPLVNKNSKKSEGFAVGVTASHYWMITALADGKKTNRMAVLEDIIDYFIQNKLATKP